MQLPRDLQVVVFDVGNTLIELDHARIAECARGAGLQADTASCRVAELRARKELDAYLASPGRSTEATGTLDIYMERTFHHLGGATGWQPLVARRAELWTSPVAGAGAVLAELRALGLRLAVVSNSDGHVAELLASVGFAEYFEVIVDSGIVGIEKPDPRIFTHALSPLDVDPAQALYIGDLYHVDVRGAEQAGLYPILLDPLGNRDDVEVMRVQSLDKLPGLLRR